MAGIYRLARVARKRVVVFTWDPSAVGFWLIDDYFPKIGTIDREILPTMDEIRQGLGRASIFPVPIPHDCTDGFLGAYWRRPESYLDPSVRRAISTFAKLSEIEPGLERLRADLSSGEWRRRHGAVLSKDALDLGYRLIVAA